MNLKKTDSLKLAQDKEKALLNAQLKQEQLTSKLYHNINMLTVIALTLLTTFTITVFRSRCWKQHKLNLTLYKQKEELVTVNNVLN